MSVITSIKPQKNRNRVNIYLDGVFGFGIDLENFIKLNLKVEQELSVEEIEKITQKAEFQINFNKLLNFSMIRPRSEKEIRDWQARKKVSEDLRDRLIEKLKNLDLLDDKKFASWWIDQRLNFRLSSKRILIQELRLKGIDRLLIEDALGEVEIDEVEIAYKLALKKQRLEKDKLIAFLARKGFSWNTIDAALKRMVE